jgi:peptide deformylase
MTTAKFILLQLGHPHLRLTAHAVNDIQNEDVQQFIDDLLQYVEDVNGMGIAAPQVDRSLRLFIVSCKPNIRYPYAPLMPPTVMINPEIISVSDDMEKDWEGCLSVPSIRALVPRHEWVKVRFTTRAGELIETTYSGFLARVFQHELDHLNGLVFIDRVEDSHDMMAEQEWLKLISQR